MCYNYIVQKGRERDLLHPIPERFEDAINTTYNILLISLGVSEENNNSCKFWLNSHYGGSKYQ